MWNRSFRSYLLGLAQRGGRQKPTPKVVPPIGSKDMDPDRHPIDQEAWVSLIKVLEEGIAMVRAGDYSFR